MITFKDYLLEATSIARYAPPQYKSLGVNAAIKILNKHCKDSLWMLEKNHPIYRGDRNISLTGDFATVDPSKTKRASAHTSNYYTEIFDNHPDMQDFPKRSSSFISTFNRSKTGMYLYKGQKPIILIPFDGVKIGCVNSRDMWDLQVTLYDKSDYISNWNDEFEIFPDLYPTWSSFKEFQRIINHEDRTDNHSFFELLFGMRAKKEKFLEEIIKGYNPKTLGFTCETTKTVSHAQDGEVWVGGPCMIITEDMWEQLRAALVTG